MLSWFVLKCDFHLHSLEDPRDVLSHDARQLVNHAAELHYDVLALTLHSRLYCPQELRDYAKTRGILMIPGVEHYLERVEVLLLGVEEMNLKSLNRFDDLRSLRKERGDDLLVIAPHPFYVLGQCAGEKLAAYPDVFDAVEFCHFYTSWWNPNRRADEVAQQIGKPMIACSDTHQLKWMRNHYSLVDAQPTQAGVFAAIRAGRVQNVSRPLGSLEFFGKALWHLGMNDPLKIARKWGWISPPSSNGEISRNTSDG